MWFMCVKVAYFQSAALKLELQNSKPFLRLKSQNQIDWKIQMLEVRVSYILGRVDFKKQSTDSNGTNLSPSVEWGKLCVYQLLVIF